MMDLPLFPLNTVIFPGWPMPLHIFEPRYKEMVRYCVEEQQPFGIVLIEEGEEEFDTAAIPHRIGCTVAITQLEKTEDGRLYIMTIGQERFRIRKLKRDRPYLVGEVEMLDFETEDSRVLNTAVAGLRPLVIDYFAALAQVDDDDEIDTSQIPSDPEELSYLAAAILQVSLETKQTMLSARKASNLLNYLTGVYKRELRLIPRQDMGSFSPN
jgi:Lon protease-like protein